MLAWVQLQKDSLVPRDFGKYRFSEYEVTIRKASSEIISVTFKNKDESAYVCESSLEIPTGVAAQLARAISFASDALEGSRVVFIVDEAIDKTRK